MIIPEITYEQLFPNPYVQFGNIRMAIKIILEDGDTIADAFSKGHQEANENFNRLFPQLTVNPDYEHLFNGEPIISEEVKLGRKVFKVTDQPKQSRVEVLIQDIERCKSLEGANGLLSWRLLVSKNPELQPAFDKKMEELSK